MNINNHTVIPTDSRAGYEPPLRVTEEEATIRRATKERVAAKYGFTNWNHAPDEALREYHEFLRKRASSVNQGGHANDH